MLRKFDATLWSQTGKNNTEPSKHRVVDFMIKKSAILLVGAVLIVSVLASGCTFNVGNTTTSPSTTTYTSSKGYSIAYPSDWGKPEEQNNGAVALFLTPTSNKTENLNVQAYNLSADDTLSKITASIRSEWKDFRDFQAN